MRPCDRPCANGWPVQPDELAAVADVVAQAIQEALAPVLERLAVAEARLEDRPGEAAALGLLRERVAIVETKAAQPGPVPVALPIDLTPVLERVATAEARLQTLGDLRDRVVMIETKAAAPALADPAIAPLLSRLDVLDVVQAQLATGMAGLVREVHENRVVDNTHADANTRELALLSERVAVVETRAPVPGPAGRDGQDGMHGKDGADGLGFEDLDVAFDGDRRLELRFERAGGRAKSFPITLPFLRYQGVYQDGKAYDAGDTVSWGGSAWHCNEPTTTKPGDGSKAWTLCVKRGRDGKDGVDAPGALPAVKVR